ADQVARTFAQLRERNRDLGVGRVAGGNPAARAAIGTRAFVGQADQISRTACAQPAQACFGRDPGDRFVEPIHPFEVWAKLKRSVAVPDSAASVSRITARAWRSSSIER